MFRRNSNDLIESIIKILDELNNSSTLKPCNEALIHNGSESVIDFNVDPQFNMQTCEINDNNNFDCIKQIARW